MQERKLTIYFTSDLHSYIYPTDYRSQTEKDLGLFKCASRFQKDGDTLIIDGGDLLQGSPFGAYCHDTIGSAEKFAEIMNRCGYDYVTLGNHDFNYGMAYLDSYLDALHARCVCQNVRRADDSTRFPARVHTLENGLRVGIVGIVTDYVNIWERPEHLSGITIEDPLPAAASALAALKGNVDLTVCVYHGGFERDLASGRTLSATRENVAYRICQELGFDILLTGHQHMSVPGQMVQGTFVVQPSDKGQEFLKVEAAVSDDGAQFSSRTIHAGGPCRPEWLAEFSGMERGAQDWLDEVVGHLPEPMAIDTPLHMAAYGNPLADLFNTVQLLASAEYFTKGEDGSLAISDAFLKPKVEHYNYDYYAGVHYVFDCSKPVGHRVTELRVNGKSVAADDVFTACLSSYRASGTGGYDCYSGCPVLREIGTEMSDLLLDFFKDPNAPERIVPCDFRVI